MATVFDLFKSVSYKYVPVKRGVVRGNVLDMENARDLLGVFKDRNGFTRAGNIETIGSNNKGDMATLHAHPEDYDMANDDIIGNAIIVHGVEYEIKGLTSGTNFDTGIVEHLTFTLARVDYAD